MKIQCAFPKKTLDEFFSPWINSINSRECISVTNIPKREQLYYLNDFKDYYLSNSLNLITIDLKGQIIEDPSDLNILLKNKIKNSLKKTILVILDADQLLDEKYNLVSYLDSLYHQKKNISIIYLFQTNIANTNMANKISKYTTLFQNISIYQYFEKKDMDYFFEYTAKNFKIKLISALKNKILYSCGGSPWLIKHTIRYFYQTKDEKNIFTNDGIEMRLNILFQELSQVEKIILEKIIKEDFSFNSQEKISLGYLLKTRLLNKINRKYKITIPLFENFIKKYINSKTKIELNNSNQIIVNNILIESFFSRREKIVIRYFIKNKEKIIKREELASIIWQSNQSGSYTDWSLDQIIRRLRIKLKRLGLDEKIIKTIKNQGYFFQ